MVVQVSPHNVVAMAHFPATGIRFLGDLALNNNKEWFDANRKRYEAEVRDPAKEFFEEFVQLSASIFGCAATGKQFRINRDIRFSRDKTPYSPFVRMVSCHESECAETHGGFMGSIEPDKHVVGVGIWEFDKEKLARFRARTDFSDLDTVLADLPKGVHIPSPELKKIPKECADRVAPSDHLRRKGLVLFFESDLGQNGIDLKEWEPTLRALLPVHRWLHAL